MNGAVWIFAGSVLFMLYIMAGYPLLLRWWAAKRSRPVQKANQTVPVSFIIAVRNGEQWIEPKLDSIFALDYPHHQIQVVVISDGSTDATEAAVERYSTQHPERQIVLKRQAPAGKAAALNVGIAAATNDILVLTDVRQQLDRPGLRHLAACFADPEVGVASGDLIIRSSTDSGAADIGLYRRYESWIRARMSDLDSMFGATGSYYAMRRSLAVTVPQGTLLDDMHLPLAAFFQGYRSIIEPEAVAFDEPTALDAEFPRKVRTLAGNWQILARYPALLTPANRMLVHFLSHKFGRLLLPFALLAALISSFWLPDPWRWIAWAGQAGFYGLALLHPVLPAALQKLSSPIRTFVVLMLATLCAPAFVFLPAEWLWKPTQLKTNGPPATGGHPKPR